jgi:hypothetical protein
MASEGLRKQGRLSAFGGAKSHQVWGVALKVSNDKPLRYVIVLNDAGRQVRCEEVHGSRLPNHGVGKFEVAVVAPQSPACHGGSTTTVHVMEPNDIQLSP